MPVPAVTVVIPAYKAPAVIARAMDSVFVQEFGDWELLIIDDESPDDTGEVARKHGEGRAVRVIRQTNGGPGAARNTGMTEAAGRYVAFLDADDRWHPQFLSSVVAFLDANPGCVACTSNVYWEGAKDEFYRKYAPGEIAVDERGVVTDFLAMRQIHRCFPQISALAVRREVFLEYGGFDPEVACGEEEELLLRWLPQGPIGYIEEPLAWYYDTPGSFIKNFDRAALSNAVLWKKTLPRDGQLAGKFPGYPAYRDARLFRSIFKCVAAGQFQEARELGAAWPKSPWSKEKLMAKAIASLPRPLMSVARKLGRKIFLKQ
jgi:glycosyltransferase involved in cell wall biosynthesis